MYGIGPTTNQYFVIKAGGKFEYTLSGYDLRYYDNDTIRMINDYLVIPITETGSRGTIIIADASGDTWTFEDDTSYISSSLRNTDRYIWLYFNDGSSGWSVVFDMQTKTFSTKLQETNTSDYRTISNYIYSN